MQDEFEQLTPATDEPHKPPVPAPPQGMAAVFLDRERRLRTAWRFLIFGIGFAIVNIAVSLVLGIGLAVVLTIRGGGPQDPRDLQLHLEQHMALLTGIASLPITVLVFALIAACRLWLDRRPLYSLGLVRVSPPSILIACLLGMLPILLSGAAVWLAGGYRLAGVALPWQALLLVPVLLLMAFMEEIMFRGYLLQNLLEVRRPVFGVLFTSVVFWLMHAANPNAWDSVIIPLNLFGAGLVLALAYLASGNIWFPTSLHFGWNAAQGLLLGVPISGMAVPGLLDLQPIESGPDWLTGGDFGLEASLVTLAAEAVLLVGLATWFTRARRTRKAIL